MGDLGVMPSGLKCDSGVYSNGVIAKGRVQ